MTQKRAIENNVSPIFVERWSPRAFDESALEPDDLAPLFEAARWAPSAYNAQPWHFVHARRGSPQWQTFLDLIAPYNREWAEHASALIIAISEKTFVPPGQTDAISTGFASYDTGAAVAYLVLQASLSGLAAHIVAGLDQDKTRAALGIPENFHVETAIIVGRRGNAESLSPKQREREAPNDRKPLEAIVSEGRFAFNSVYKSLVTQR